MTSPADAMRFRDEFNRFESLAAAAAASFASSSSSPAPPPSSSSDERMMIGDWTLIATANLPPRVGKRRGGCDDDTKTTSTTKKEEGGGETKLDPLREAIKRSIGVIQRIRSVGGDTSSGTIDRVDNVIEFAPLETLDGILPGELPLFGSLSSLAPTLDKMLDFANPLKLKKAKAVLVHKAEVESTRPVLRTRIAWTSSVRESPPLFAFRPFRPSYMIDFDTPFYHSRGFRFFFLCASRPLSLSLTLSSLSL